MMDFLLYISIICGAFIWLTPREERSTLLGVKQIGRQLLWFIIIMLLLGNLFLFYFLESFQTFFQNNILCYSFNSLQDYSLIQDVNSFNYLFTSDTIWFDNSNLTEGFFLGNKAWSYLSSGHGDMFFHNILDVVDISFFSVELVVSFVIACFCTISIFFSLLLTRPGVITSVAASYLSLLVLVSLSFIFCPSMFSMFISFECLLLISLGLLKLTSKSERIGEAISEMFMWTLFGSFFLLMGFFSLYSEYGNNLDIISSWDHVNVGYISDISCLFFLIGFGVKIPTWPFISWLLKAHVEASVEFSILLSGFIVKLGILGLWRILDAFSPDWIYLLVLGVSCLAIIDATLRLFAQTDLKRIVALTTVIEMNWLNLCFVLGDVNLMFLANFLIVAHCFTTTSEFLLVEFISKRYGTRDFWQISGLWYNTPILWYFSFIVVFTTIGFPGTSIFLAKFLFLTTIMSYSVWLFLFFIVIFFFVLPLFFVRLWVPVWFGLNNVRISNISVTLDLTSKEIFILSFSTLMGISLGLFPTMFFNIF